MLVDDHEMVRTGLRTFLELQEDMVVVGETSNGEQALELVAAMHPDIVLLDLVLPGLSGVETARRLRDTHPDVKVVVLTSFSGQGSVLPAVRAGLAGYLLKDVGPGEFASVLRSVHHGGAPLHPRVAATVMRSVTLVVTPERGIATVDGLRTGWHEPAASHLLMLEALAGRDLLAASYAEAIRTGYRWHEFRRCPPHPARRVTHGAQWNFPLSSEVASRVLPSRGAHVPIRRRPGGRP
ncbi:MAG: response regulator [Pseudonocardiaceae bacterium]